MWQLQSLAKLCRTYPCPSHDEVIKQDLGLGQKGKGGFGLRRGHSALLEKLERFLFCLKKYNHAQIMHKSSLRPQQRSKELLRRGAQAEPGLVWVELGLWQLRLTCSTE